MGFETGEGFLKTLQYSQEFIDEAVAFCRVKKEYE